MNILFESFLWFFAIFGVIQLMGLVYQSLCEHYFKEDDPFIVIKVKNQQESIEWIIRSLVWDSLNNKKSRTVPNILAVDLGSTDETRLILDRLAKEYMFIAVTDEQGYLSAFGEEQTIEKIKGA